MTASADGDLLELLFPEGGADLDRGRRWTQLLRLVVDDVRGARAALAPTDLPAARRTLVAADLDRAAAALGDLVAHLLDGLLDEDSWFALARPGRAWGEAWSAFTRTGGVLAPPAPTEPLGRCAERAVSAFEELAARACGVAASRLARRAHALRFALVRAVEGPRALAASLEASAPRSVPARVAALEARVLLALERGDPRGACNLIAGDRAAAAVDEELARLDELARGLLEGSTLPPWPHAVPSSLAGVLGDGVLGDGGPATGRRPASSAGNVDHGVSKGDSQGTTAPSAAPASARAPDAAAGPTTSGPGSHANAVATPAAESTVGGSGRGPHAAGTSRRALGAGFVGLFLVDEDGEARLAAHEVAPAARDLVASFARERALEWRSAGAAEREALASGFPVVRRGVRQPGTLAPGTARAVAVVPCDGDGGPGWLHLEFDHALVPGPARLVAAAEAWARRAAEREEVVVARPAVSHLDARRAAVEALVGESATTAWFDVVDGTPHAVHRGSRAVLPEPRTLARAARLGLDGAGEPRVLVRRGWTIGLTVGLDATPDDDALERWQDARFADWHRERFGTAVEPALARGGLGAVELVRLGGARAALELVGGAGVGKEVVARRLHFEGARERPLRLARSEDELAAALADAELSGTLVCDAPERWSRRGQLALATAPVHLRLVALVRRSLAEGVASGDVEPALAARFARASVRVPPLAERRELLPTLLDVALARVAEEEGWRAPTPTDEARALLWRQPWAGGARELEAVVYVATLADDAEELDEPAIRAALGERGLLVVERIASDDVRSFDAALDVTRLRNGRANKRRAATYLGWDRDTVAARLKCRDEAS